MQQQQAFYLVEWDELDPYEVWIAGIMVNEYIGDEDVWLHGKQRFLVDWPREAYPTTVVLTEDELLMLDGGPRALEEWNAKDYSRRGRSVEAYIRREQAKFT